MKKINILFAAIFAVVMLACQPNEDVIFGVEVGTEDGNIAIGPEGGQVIINVNADEEWTAITEEPWIMVSPANGRGSQKCVVSIDSTILNVERPGAIRIKNLVSGEKCDFTVNQKGFEYQIALDSDVEELEDFAAFESRSFNVEVYANIDFDVVLPEGAEKWLVP